MGTDSNGGGYIYFVDSKKICSLDHKVLYKISYQNLKDRAVQSELIEGYAAYIQS